VSQDEVVWQQGRSVVDSWWNLTACHIVQLVITEPGAVSACM